jgi:LCP family protein required for cell wall assembly
VDRLALSLLDGPTGLVVSLCRSLGVAVDHLVKVHFDGLRALVDSTGGLVVRLDHPARDLHTGLGLPAGESRLDGAEALAWIRSRHIERLTDGDWVPDAASDTGRQERQRELLDQVTSEMLRRARNPIAAQRFAWTASGAMTTDSATGPVDLAALALTIRRAGVRDSLPHDLADGHIPVATLTPPAQPVLDGLRNGRPDGPPCPRARVSR